MMSIQKVRGDRTTGAEGAAAAGPAASAVAEAFWFLFFYNPQELQPLAQEVTVFRTESPPQQHINSYQVLLNCTKKKI